MRYHLFTCATCSLEDPMKQTKRLLKETLFLLAKLISPEKKSSGHVKVLFIHYPKPYSTRRRRMCVVSQCVLLCKNCPHQHRSGLPLSPSLPHRIQEVALGGCSVRMKELSMLTSILQFLYFFKELAAHMRRSLCYMIFSNAVTEWLNSLLAAHQLQSHRD